MGGWIFGFMTILTALAIPVSDVIGLWPGPSWSATVGVFVMLFTHIIWGAAGYYPRRI